MTMGSTVPTPISDNGTAASVMQQVQVLAEGAQSGRAAQARGIRDFSFLVERLF